MTVAAQVIRVKGQCFLIRRISRRTWLAISGPDGVLPVRSSIATGRPVAVSYTWIGRKQRVR
jgi:hypothetical protein